MCEKNTWNYSELIESGSIIEPKKEWNHSHHHLSACFSMKFSICFLGKVICSQSGLVHLIICRLKGLCRLTSKIAIAIARLGTRHFTNSFRFLHHFHPLSIPLLRSNPSSTFTESFAKNPLQETRPSFHWDSVPAATDAYPSPESMPKSLLSERCEVISSEISIAKRENVPPSFGPRPRGCKSGLLQPLWRNWY